MAEYTYDNVLINPSKEGIESLIGKEVYFHNNPCLCLDAANKNSTVNLGILIKICKDSINPFVIEKESGFFAYPCIIEKKEEPKPEYVPFENAEEFLNAYDYTNHSVENGSVENKLINYGGIWLKDSEIDAYCMVTEIWDTGVVIGNKNITIGETTVFNDITSWDELLEYFTFLYGTPCGKEVK